MSITLQRPINDNRPGVAAEFVRIPSPLLKVSEGSFNADRI